MDWVLVWARRIKAGVWAYYCLYYIQGVEGMTSWSRASSGQKSRLGGQGIRPPPKLDGLPHARGDS